MLDVYTALPGLSTWNKQGASDPPEFACDCLRALDCSAHPKSLSSESLKLPGSSVIRGIPWFDWVSFSFDVIFGWCTGAVESSEVETNLSDTEIGMSLPSDSVA